MIRRGEGRILIIDDERPVLMTIEALLKRRGFEVSAASSAAAGLEALERYQSDLVLLDLGLPDADGLEVLKTIRKKAPSTEVLILTANNSLANAIESIKQGAFHFVGKPYAPEELINLIFQAMEHRRLRAETVLLREESERLEKRLQEAEAQLHPVFQSRSMREIDALVRRVAPTDANILILGESGVGKEVLASRIHELSSRRGRPMVRLNCAAFPPNMIESELFGYVKGAFTGATADFPGMIREANSGTLFLDEVAEMPLELQTRFLRVLQEREYRPLGSTRTLKADFRLVAATNRSVSEVLSGKVLRQDLYYRINTFRIAVPPLRERREDIPSLVQRFAARFGDQYGLGTPAIDPRAMERLIASAWPGNVRELQNAIEYAVILSGGKRILEEHLPPDLSAREGGCVVPPGLVQADLREVEKQAILRALEENGGNKKRTAEALGIQRGTLYAKLRRYGVRPVDGVGVS
ncbi:MAG: hypothetical protein RLZZ142_507 [Verrucomicrobiota bacterium]|jgi:DNA-binding NtrC family response regulator